MDENKRKITVWENGKQVKLYVNKNREIPSGRNEQAAALSDSEDEKIPPYTRVSDTKPSKFAMHKRKWKEFKPAILSVLSALVIGSFLGIMMLNMFIMIEDDNHMSGNQNSSAAVTNDDDQDNDKQADRSASSVRLDEIRAYVLQGGVFSEKANADVRAGSYRDRGVPVTIWERGDQYFLFIAAATTETQAEQLQQGLVDTDMDDIYVKEWSTGNITTDLTRDENSWAQSFIKTWKDTLESGEFEKNTWDSLLKAYPKDSEQLKELYQSTQQVLEKAGQAEALQKKALLMELWKTFGTTLNN
ncbi:hypothetical protein [Virgibacillus sp. Bac332]|uniref:hypothetical protein n=1 Tax=Virgibacillus sp. Bac332 TaxID=2419842 RepID=UPI000EF55532|nr:hypothetical protein [Virgibacillus sp. Bac332]